MAGNITLFGHVYSQDTLIKVFEAANTTVNVVEPKAHVTIQGTSYHEDGLTRDWNGSH